MEFPPQPSADQAESDARTAFFKEAGVDPAQFGSPNLPPLSMEALASCARDLVAAWEQGLQDAERAFGSPAQTTFRLASHQVLKALVQHKSLESAATDSPITHSQVEPSAMFKRPGQTWFRAQQEAAALQAEQARSAIVEADTNEFPIVTATKNDELTQATVTRGSRQPVALRLINLLGRLRKKRDLNTDNLTIYLPEDRPATAADDAAMVTPDSQGSVEIMPPPWMVPLLGSWQEANQKIGEPDQQEGGHIPDPSEADRAAARDIFRGSSSQE